MVNEIRAKTILNRHKRRDDWFLDDYSVNPYPCCSLDCLYCYTKGSKYGMNMPKMPSVKVNAPELLRKELLVRAKKREYGYIAFASHEPYPPAERRLGVTRKMLETVLMFKFPVLVLTKSTLVLRDLDLLKDIEKCAVLPDDLRERPGRGAVVTCSISTLDEGLAKVLEPGAAPPGERLGMLRKCADEGLMTGVCFIPVLPFISDSEQQLDLMIGRAAEHGAEFVLVGGLTLFGRGPGDCRMLYFKFLEERFPELVPRYKEFYGKGWSRSWSYQEGLDEISRRMCRKHGIRYRMR